MEIKSFKEIMIMITNACNDVFYSGSKGMGEKIIECATQIYIAQFEGGENK